ncbi:MAG: hypothetical protein CVU59_06415 [Deltaproteobacteria bacterium HGW-Deltaproteobacteria-17]|nr:MAG: hypothetical protein CVU59_06415 [Deltaproteobacteria bacterium HGW-Deltaproteobacteria-17]
MRSRSGRLFFSLMLCSLCLSCDDGARKETTDPCADVTCEEWQACNAGDCLTVEGRCNNYTDCADDMFCDDDLHVCRGPRRPGDDLLMDLEGNSVAFSFAGLINPETAENTILGDGAYTLDIEDLLDVLTEYAYVLEYTFPEDTYDPGLAGVRTLVLGVSKIHAQSGSELDYYHFSWIVEKDLLMEALDADDPLIGSPRFIRFSLMDVNQYTRPWDRTMFQKYCAISMFDTTDGRGLLFLDHYDNTTFEAGEDLRIWGNLPLTTRLIITPENEEANCTYRIGETYVTKAEFDAGRASTEPALSCGLPADFFEAPAAMHLEYFFSGAINPETATIQTVINGYADATAMLQEEVVVDDYSALALYISTGIPEPVDYAQSIGGIEMITDDHYTFYMLGLTVHTSTLAAMKEGLTTVLPWDANHMLAAIELHEERVVGQDTFSKICPVGITGADATGDLLACTGNNTAFLPGETLELAVSVELTTDAAVLGAAYGYADGQTCHCQMNYGTIDCAVFDQLGNGE